MADFTAWHAPLLADDDVARIDEHVRGGIAFHTPVLRSGAMTRLAARLRRARTEHLLQRPVDGIVDIIDRAVQHMTAGAMRDTALRALPAANGMSPAMAARTLDMMARDWRRGPLHTLLRTELHDPRMLDQFVMHGDRMTRVFGAPLITHIFAGNVPGVAVTSLIRALLVKSASIGKTAAAEPVLAPLFARALHDVNPDVGACIATLYWEGGYGESEAEALAAADSVVVYGATDAVASVRTRTPARTMVVEHGPRMSIGIVARAALHGPDAVAALAGTIATATAEFDQHGCVSPHIVFVERGGEHTPRELAAAIADALARLNETLPRRPLTAADAARMREAATAAEFRAIGGHDIALFEHSGALVIHDDEPVITASCLNRMLHVKSVDHCADVVPIIAPYRDVLQSAAIAGLNGDELQRFATLLADAGITRITDFERMPWPAASWHHDGRGPLLELLRFIDLDLPDHD